MPGMNAPMLLLATPRSQYQIGDLLMPLVYLLAAVFAVVVAAWLIRRSLRDTPGDAAEGAFTLSDLRRLRAEGKMSEVEYERARAALIAQSTAMMNRTDAQDQPSSGPSDSDKKKD